MDAMKTLCLVRHAKSSWDDAVLPDRDRPLAERGWRELAKMGKRLARRECRPDLILTSPALRALTTTEGIAKALDYRRRQIVVDDRLYAHEAEELLELVRALAGWHKCVMLVGHNPELSELAQRLSSDIASLPTCAVAELRFDSKSWADVGKAAPARVELDYPKKGKKAP